MATIFRKSAKGLLEIETRAHRLPPRLRSALIIVDGKRTDVELQALVQQAPEVLGALLEQGFIEVVPAPAAPPVAAPVRPPAAPVLDLGALQREMVRALTDLIGPAAESLALRIERTKSADELRALLEPAASTIASMRGRDAAAAWLARFSGRLALPAAATGG